MTEVAVAFLVGAFVGSIATAFWNDLLELLGLYREER